MFVLILVSGFQLKIVFINMYFYNLSNINDGWISLKGIIMWFCVKDGRPKLEIEILKRPFFQSWPKFLLRNHSTQSPSENVCNHTPSWRYQANIEEHNDLKSLTDVWKTVICKSKLTLSSKGFHFRYYPNNTWSCQQNIGPNEQTNWIITQLKPEKNSLH